MRLQSEANALEAERSAHNEQVAAQQQHLQAQADELRSVLQVRCCNRLSCRVLCCHVAQSKYISAFVDTASI